MEEALRNSEERLRILFEFAPDAYILCDLAGNIIDGNRMMKEIAGYKRCELIGKHFSELSPEQILKAAASLAKRALGQSTGPDKYIVNRKDAALSTTLMAILAIAYLLVLGQFSFHCLRSY